MSYSRWIASALLAATGALAAAPEARAADPLVLGVAEAETPNTGDRVLVVYGLLMTRVKTWELRETGGTSIAPLTILFKSRNTVTLALPATLAMTHTVPGPFALHYTFGRTGLGDVDINITGGAPALGSVSSAVLDPALLTNLNDAETLTGETAADLHDWGNLTNVPSDFADGVDDSVSFAGNGIATTASRSDHDHDFRYFTEAELNLGDGVVNQAGDPVDWTRIKGIPAGFADGIDDGGGGAYTAGSGLVLTTTVFSADFTTSGGDAGTDTKVARGNHLHDGRYYTETELNAAGTINTGSNPVDWTKLKNVPAAFADGTDDGASLTQGNGILISGGVVSANFGGTGSATTVARSDHNHNSTYLTLTGGSLTGTLTINASSNAIVATSGATGSTGGIDSTTSGGTAFVGHGDVGVYGDCDSDGFVGVHGASLPGGYYQVGVYGYAYENSSSAMYAYHFYGGYALDAHSWNGTAILARTSNLYGGDIVTVQGYTGNGYNTGVRVRMSGYGNTAFNGYASGSNSRGALIAAYGSYSLGAYIGSNGYSSRGLFLYNYGYRGTGFYQSSSGYRSRGMVVQHYGYYATGFFLRTSGKNSTAMIVDLYSYGNLAVFRNYGSNVARINYAGYGYFNGGVTTGGADFAESVKVDTSPSEFEPGDVVIIDTDAVRQFSLSRESMSSLVAGVISTKAALIGTTHNVAAGKEANATRKTTEVHLGIVGIVPTKVCDEGGAIRAGDLLVTASIPGHARKAPANPAPGTILGKALAPHGKGQGKVEVLLISR